MLVIIFVYCFYIFGAIVRVCAQADGDFDAPGVKQYEGALQMLLNQQMDEHGLMSRQISLLFGPLLAGRHNHHPGKCRKDRLGGD